jgi:hypothetical protein
MARCCGVDHHNGEYTPRQRADLDLVLAFNRKLAAAIDNCRDTSEVTALLDPDPLRYMWVDEGAGRIPEFIRRAKAALADAKRLDGHARGAGLLVHDGRAAARPSVATNSDGDAVQAWVEWEKDIGERVWAKIGRAAPDVLSGNASDCFRPTALFDSSGHPWVFYARNDNGAVSVFARRHMEGTWGPEECVSTTEHPSFNQEVVAHADGSVEVCWQGRSGGRFAIFSRRWSGTGPSGRGWSETRQVSDDVANVWDPAIAARPDGGAVYAWTEYHDGAYRIVLRTADAAGHLAPSRPLTSGSDYALHPTVAVTTDGGIWCGFDVITIHAHGGSGPTRLRRTDQLHGRLRPEGIREAGDFVPPELLPEVEASMRVVRVDSDALRLADGEIAPGLDTVPGGLPRLVATTDGGLVLAYRVHRRLPLMTYYWEVATQTLGATGWSAPTTYAGSDGTLEEASLARLPGGGALLVWQTDGRLERGLSWTEGFGGRECPYLLEHHGEVIWHGMHGAGTVRSATVAAGTGSAGGPARAGRALAIDHHAQRREARAWLDGDDERYTTTVDGRELSLYWGDLHRHSLVSRCTSGDEPSLEDFYRYAWDVCEYDFWAVTDHSENSSDYQWWSIQKIADLFRVDHRFVPLYGFEWTGDTGHQNVIYGDVARGAPIFSAYAAGSQTPAELWAKMREHPDFPAITIPHHPGSAMVPFDWGYDDPDFVRLVEVFQACRGNYEDDGCFRQYSDGTLPGTFVQDGLRRGRRFGLIASSDHGHGASYIGAFAERLDRSSVFEALHARRVFAATTRGVLVDFRIGLPGGESVFMGGEATSAGPVEVDAYVHGYGELARIDVVRNGLTVHSVLPDLGLPDGWRAVPLRLEWGLGPETTDWSGTLTVEGGRILPTPYWSPEIVDVDDVQVSWVASTKSFGEPYGAQRGGIEVTVTGPDNAVVSLKTAQAAISMPLGALGGGVVEVPVTSGRLRLQPGVGGLTGLGTPDTRLRWTDPAEQPAWYYIRAFQTDGEMAWSSPIWIDRP